MDEILVSANISGMPAILGNRQSPQCIVIWADGDRQTIKGAIFQASGSRADFPVKAADGTSVNSPVITDVGNAGSPGFAVGWIAAGNVLLQIFDADGRTSGGLVQANTAPVGTGEVAPAVAGLSDGTFVVVWGQGPAGIRAQIFKRDGTRIGPELAVNTSSGSLSSPAATKLRDGGFVIAWQTDPSGRRHTQRLQIFRQDGTKVGDEQTPRLGAGIGPQTLTFIEADVNAIPPIPSNFANVLIVDDEPVGAANVFVQLLGPDGAFKDFTSPTQPEDQPISSSPAVAAVPPSSLVVTWSQQVQPASAASGQNINAMRIDASDFLFVGDATIVQIDTGAPGAPKRSDSPCLAVMGESGDSIAIAWVEQDLQASAPASAVKLRIVSGQLT